MRVEERLLKYVSYWTTSDEECRQIPSSERHGSLTVEYQEKYLQVL